MKAITVKSRDLQAPIEIEDCFGKAKYFCFIKDGVKEPKFVKNPGYGLQKGSGLRAVNFLNENGVKTVISRNYGILAKNKLDNHKIQIVIIPSKYKNLSEIIALINKEN